MSPYDPFRNIDKASTYHNKKRIGTISPWTQVHKSRTKFWKTLSTDLVNRLTHWRKTSVGTTGLCSLPWRASHRQCWRKSKFEVYLPCWYLWKWVVEWEQIKRRNESATIRLIIIETKVQRLRLEVSDVFFKFKFQKILGVCKSFPGQGSCQYGGELRTETKINTWVDHANSQNI